MLEDVLQVPADKAAMRMTWLRGDLSPRPSGYGRHLVFPMPF